MSVEEKERALFAVWDRICARQGDVLLEALGHSDRSDCENMFLREQNMTPVFRALNDMCIVCDGCYTQLKGLHSARN